MKKLSLYISEAKEAKVVPTVEWMKEHYAKFNKELFNNELPDKVELGLVDVSSKKDASCLGIFGFNETYYYYRNQEDPKTRKYYMFIPTAKFNKYLFTTEGNKKVEDPMELKPYIKMNPRYKFDKRQMEDTFIHEMVHFWTHLDGKMPKMAHGKEFKAKCDEIREKAKKLYDIEYDLLTYANQGKNSDAGYELNDEIQTKLKKQISKANVYSIYWAYDKNDKTIKRDYERVIFVLKKNVDMMVAAIKQYPGRITEMWVSPHTYEDVCMKHGKIPTQNRLRTYYMVDRVGGAEQFKKDAENVMSANEGLVSKLKGKLKDLLDKILSTGIKVTKDMPVSAFDAEQLLDDADKVTNNAEDIKGDTKLEATPME